MSDELPKGWASAPVAEVIEDFQPGFASGEKNVEGGVAHLRMNNIGLDGELVLDLIRTVPENLAKPRHDLLPGDVLVCTTNSGVLVGKCAYFDLKGRYAFSNHLTRLRPKRNVIDGSFLRWNLWLHWKRGVFDDKCKHWVNQSSLPKDALLEDEVVVPPLAEQRRIVAKLEKLLGQVDTCQQRLEKLPTLLKRFRQSILAAACSGRLTADWREENPTEAVSEAARKILAADATKADLYEIPDSWVCTKLDRVCLKITDGEHLTPPVTELGVPLLSAKDVRDNHLDFSDTKFVSEEFSKKSRLRCDPEQGDILVVSRGATVGRTCRVQVPDVFCLMGSVLLFKPDVRYVVPQLIEFCFKSPSGLAALIATSSSTAQQAIYIKDMRSFALPVPPLAEQQEIVRRVAGLFALADQLEQRLAQARQQVDKLTPSLLARAFAGQLVPQNPADEPAEKLLERIKNQKS